MKSKHTVRLSASNANTRWMGAGSAALLLVFVASTEGGLIGGTTANILSLLLLGSVLVWALMHTDRWWRLSEVYLWLAFIFSLYHLMALSEFLSGLVQVRFIDLFRGLSILHLLVIIVALWNLGAWSRESGDAEPSSRLARFAAGLLISGAVVFWVGARTFPGMALEFIYEQMPEHVWTSASFLFATVVTLPALLLLTLALRKHGEVSLPLAGLILFAFGAVFWAIHLTLRLTVMVHAAAEWGANGVAPEWYEPWRLWSAFLFGAYTILAYIGLALYGLAMLRSGITPRWSGWMCILAGLAAAALGGLPLLIHVPLWLIGILILTKSAGLAVSGDPHRIQ